MNATLRQRARRTLDQLRLELLEQRSPEGHWVGQLSASALATATAVSAMSATLIWSGDHDQDRNDDFVGNLHDDLGLRDKIVRGIAYLIAQQNADGGFGDTDRSHSNIATSYLVLAASALAERATGKTLGESRLSRLNQYINRGGQIDGLRRRYGKDKTFVIPIMANMAIGGLIDWDDVSALPFEAALVPQSLYRWMRMPVVSYAIPALVAIGQTRHFHGPRAFLPLRWLRSVSVRRTTNVLRRMQPESGGYLEATPLTSFVVMSLAATGRSDHKVTCEGLRFLAESMQDDGSWPIDTNLATWVTSLSIDALAVDPQDDGVWCSESLVRWHLSCQHSLRHPFTGADPGGWGWSDRSGAVPDGDDTPGAIVAIAHCRKWSDLSLGPEIDDAIWRGQQWLLRLQNRDGGWPTFCRGWGKLPFDRSSTDLTAHAITAIGVSHRKTERSGDAQSGKSADPLSRGRKFLARSQQADGCWLPLWFGNQDRPQEDNPVYGTAKVLMATRAADGQSAERAVRYLVEHQNRDGGWGGGSSVTRHWETQGGIEPNLSSTMEETALAVDALAGLLIAENGDFCLSSQSRGTAGNESCRQAIIRGIEFLLTGVDQRRHNTAWPIGFYFAKLWYYERLYPLIFTVKALGMFLRATEPVSPTDSGPDESHHVSAHQR